MGNTICCNYKASHKDRVEQKFIIMEENFRKSLEIITSEMKNMEENYRKSLEMQRSGASISVKSLGSEINDQLERIDKTLQFQTSEIGFIKDQTTELNDLKIQNTAQRIQIKHLEKSYTDKYF